VISCLAVGIALTTATLDLIDRALFEAPTGVANPHEMVRLYSLWRQPNGATVASPFFSPRELSVLRAGAGRFASFSAIAPKDLPVYGNGNLLDVRVAAVDSDYFALLRGRDASGLAAAFQPDGVLISHRIWRDLFGSMTQPLGQSIRVGDFYSRVAGVLPDGFDGGEEPAVEVWVPLAQIAPTLRGPRWRESDDAWLEVVARTRQPRALVSDATTVLAQINDNGSAERSIVSSSLVAPAGPDNRTMQHVYLSLVCAACGILLIAASSAGGLVLLRILGRRQTMAVSRALGASPRRIRADVILEILYLAGGAVGAAWLLIPLVGEVEKSTILAGSVSLHPTEVTLGPMLFGGSALVATTAVLILALLSLARLRIDSLQVSGHATANHSTLRAQRAIIAGQTAATVILLSGATVFVRSLKAVRSIPLGIHPEHVVIVTSSVAAGRHPAWQVTRAFAGLAASIGAVPGVEQASQASSAPLQSSVGGAVYVDGRAQPVELASALPYVNAVDTNYFRTIGTRVLRGRGFGDLGPGATRAVLVNAAFSQVAWPGEDPIGRCVHFGDPAEPCYTVRGVVESIHRLHVLPEERSMQMYVPLSTAPFAAYVPAAVVLAQIDPSADEAHVIGDIRRVIAGFSRRVQLPPVRVVSLEAAIDGSLERWRMGTKLFGTLGGIALTLSGLTVFILVATAGRERRREIAIRRALGAPATAVLAVISSVVTGPVLVGLGIGLFGSLALSRLLAASLYGVHVADAATLASSLIFTVTAVACGVLPTVRAALKADSRVELSS
jgi:predicted permease